jgi:hypothetical protein
MQPRRSAQTAEVFEHVPEFKTVDASRVSRVRSIYEFSCCIVVPEISPS